jgi:drug/metabolite transporter (DMT)-like permease
MHLNSSSNGFDKLNHRFRPEGAWALVICALGWSLGGVFLKYVNVNSFAIAGLRSTFAFLVMAVFTRQLPHFYVKDEASGKVDRAQTIYLWLSALSYAATMIMYVISNKLTYAANVIFLQYTSPVWVILFSAIILGEKNRKIDYITFAGIAVGMVLFFADSLMENQSGEFAETALLGNTIAALSGVTWAATTLFQRKQQLLIAEKIRETGKIPSHNTSKDAFMLAQIITASFGLPFIFLMERGVPDLRSLTFLLLLGLLQMGIPNIMYSIGIKKVTALSASLITMIEPLMNPVWVFLFVHEIPTVKSIVGGVIILGFILLREFVSKKR